MGHHAGIRLSGADGRPAPLTTRQIERDTERTIISEVRKIARSHTPLAIHTLVEVMGDEDHPQARVAAAKAMIELGWGKNGSEAARGGGGLTIVIGESERKMRLIGPDADAETVDV